MWIYFEIIFFLQIAQNEHENWYPCSNFMQDRVLSHELNGQFPIGLVGWVEATLHPGSL